MRSHGRNRRLAVHPADEDAFFSGHEGGERFGATDERFSRGARGIEGGIPGANSRGVDDHLGIVRIGGAVRRAEIEPERLQALHLRGVDFVRSADAVAESQEECGDAAHARTGHADQMDAARRSVQELGQFADVHFVACVNTSATLFAASCGASDLEAAAMDSKDAPDARRDFSRAASEAPAASFSGRRRAAPAFSKMRAFRVW